MALFVHALLTFVYVINVESHHFFHKDKVFGSPAHSLRGLQRPKVQHTIFNKFHRTVTEKPIHGHGRKHPGDANAPRDGSLDEATDNIMRGTSFSNNDHGDLEQHGLRGITMSGTVQPLGSLNIPTFTSELVNDQFSNIDKISDVTKDNVKEADVTGDGLSGITSAVPSGLENIQGLSGNVFVILQPNNNVNQIQPTATGNIILLSGTQNPNQVLQVSNNNAHGVPFLNSFLQSNVNNGNVNYIIQTNAAGQTTLIPFNNVLNVPNDSVVSYLINSNTNQPLQNTQVQLINGVLPNLQNSGSSDINHLRFSNGQSNLANFGNSQIVILQNSGVPNTPTINMMNNNGDISTSQQNTGVSDTNYAKNTKNDADNNRNVKTQEPSNDIKQAFIFIPNEESKNFENDGKQIKESILVALIQSIAGNPQTNEKGSNLENVKVDPQINISTNTTDAAKVNTASINILLNQNNVITSLENGQGFLSHNPESQVKQQISADIMPKTNQHDTLLTYVAPSNDTTVRPQTASYQDPGSPVVLPLFINNESQAFTNGPDPSILNSTASNAINDSVTGVLTNMNTQT